MLPCYGCMYVCRKTAQKKYMSRYIQSVLASRPGLADVRPRLLTFLACQSRGMGLSRSSSL